MLSREAANTNFIAFGLTLPGLKPTIDCNRGKHDHHDTTWPFPTPSVHSVLIGVYNQAAVHSVVCQLKLSNITAFLFYIE
jgi:hypothetical protein